MTRKVFISIENEHDFLNALSLNISGSCKSIAAISRCKLGNVGSQRCWATRGFLNNRFTVHPGIEVVIILPLSLRIYLILCYMFKLFHWMCFYSHRDCVTPGTWWSFGCFLTGPLVNLSVINKIVLLSWYWVIVVYKYVGIHTVDSSN